MGGGGRYTTWDGPNMDRDAQYTNKEGILENRSDSYKEDYYPYAWKDVVDDTLT
jgi:hypothetical protein